MQKTIQKIHRKFDTAGEKILAEAKKIIESYDGRDVSARLVDLGFSAAKPVSNSKDLHKSQQLVRLIEEYHIVYPNYKFITEDVVNKICEKYSLVFSFVDNYIGDIPEKNIKEIEYFVRQYDIQIDKPAKFSDGMITFSLVSWFSDPVGDEFREPTQKKFKIVAPEKDFNTQNKTRKGYELINDPIVLWPVKGGYLIISKWGLESQDESLVNEINN